MIAFVRFSSLLSLVFLARETESATVISQPLSPVRVLEGQPLKLEWTLSVQGTFRRLELEVPGADSALVEITPSSTFIDPKFEGRLTASLTGRNVTITFLSVNRTDSADYAFKVFGSSGTITVPLKVIVEYPPSFKTRAPDQVVLEGGPAINLTCTADGEPAPNITWTKVFANGSDTNVLFTGQQFILPNNRTNDGTYRCNASNGIGNDVNHTVNVLVNFKPEKFIFTVEAAKSGNLCKGDTINITCSAVGKPLVHTYQVFEDDNPLHISNTPELFLSHATRTGGVVRYTCVANNTAAIANTTKNISVNEGSAIEQVENGTAVEGKNATLNCAVTGIPMPSVSWLEVKTGTHFFRNPLALTNVSRNQSGEYICQASNPCGNISKSGILTVNYPPEGVLLQVSEETVCKGANVIFTCSVADANPMNLTYHLYENDVIVSNSSSTGIWNRTMTTGGKHVYRCQVTNIVGTTMSMTVSVTVNVSSSIQAIPDKVVTEGNNATLICNASGIPKPVVSWSNVHSGEKFAGNVLVIANISRHKAGEYRCEASNPCGNATESTTIDVQFKPEMVQLVASETTVCQGESITFNCSANGNPTVRMYHLYVNDAMVNETSSTGVWNRTMTAGGVFVYKCVASNKIGTAESMNVSVAVNVSSSIQSIPDKVVTERNNVTLVCNVSGIPQPVVSWINVRSGESIAGNVLEIENISRQKAGEYRCEASNPCGNATESAIIDVQFKPEMVQLVASETTVCQGESITFNCSANGNPTVRMYHLYVNDAMVNETSSTGVWNRTMTAGGVFVYKCVASNKIGTAESMDVSVAVNVSSSIQSIPDKVVTERNNVTLVCNVSGIPQPVVSWINVRSGESIAGNVLEIENISRQKAGEYRCEASNPCGNATESAIIDVQFKPEMVQLVASETTVCQGESITFNCSANGNPTVRMYHLYVNDAMVNETSSTGVWNRTMTAGGVFVYKCVASNKIGTAESMDVSVAVNVSSSIQSIPDKVVTERNNVTLVCNVSGIPQPVVSWINVRSGESIAGNVLEIENISRQKAGEYRCEASNPCGNATESAIIDVQFKPETVQLVASETTVCQGEHITFNCSANSNPAVHTYQLYVNGTKVYETNSTGIWNTTMTTGGLFVYKCVVSNEIGTTESMGVIVTVNEPPTIEKVEESTVGTVAEGGYLTLSCQVSGDPFPSVSWVKVMGGKRFNGSNLSLRNVNGDASGEYRCEATNLCSNVSRVTEVGEQYAPKITYISASQTLNRDEMLTLNCTADGVPTPNITWTRLPNGETVNMPLTVTGNEYATVYRCTASNEIGTVFKDTLVTRGYCEEACKGGRTCRVGLCRCTDGKTGDTCEINEQPKKTVVVGIEFTMTFKAVYSDLENPETKELIVKIEVAVKVELIGTGVTQVRVASLKEGSVIADLELTFNSSTYEDYLRGRLQDATKDNKLGDLDVKQVVVGRFIPTAEPEQTCSPFFEGKDCTRAAGPLIALIVVGVILAVALLIGLVICCFHKKNASGRGSFQNVKVTQRQDPEGNNSLARDYVEPGGSRETLHGNVNTGYDPERPTESTQMVTFNSNNGQVEGIHLKDSRSQQT
ncbi:hemicentin-1-like isoform X2 [Acropora muricata]|uniref:hemicentin-1-like isoform X2 n=1 Tax=Acropora muricata TaxID=159855 RepID=UPI0034E5641A